MVLQVPRNQAVLKDCWRGKRACKTDPSSRVNHLRAVIWTIEARIVAHVAIPQITPGAKNASMRGTCITKVKLRFAAKQRGIMMITFLNDQNEILDAESRTEE